MIDEFYNILFSILKANIFAAILVILFYLIEIKYNLKIFIKYFTWKKSQKNARIATDGNTGYYAIFCLFIFIYDIVKKNVKFNFISVLLWLIIIIILSSTFHKLYSKYQGVDPNKADNDYT